MAMGGSLPREPRAMAMAVVRSDTGTDTAANTNAAAPSLTSDFRCNGAALRMPIKK